MARRPQPGVEETLARGTAAPGRRLRDLAVLLPVGFALLMLPPYVRVFDQNVALAGVPLLHLYVFGVWAAAILAAGLAARRLARSHMEPPDTARSDSTAPDAGTEPGGER